MIDLERALTDLAEHLDVPAGEYAADDLTRRLVAPNPKTRPARFHALLAAAALVVVVSAGVLTVAPARHAVAGWLGIGAVEVRQSTLPPARSATTPSTEAPAAPTNLAAARTQVQFEIGTPLGAVPPAQVLVDRRVPGGLVVLTYDHFTLVEIATDPTEPVPLAKLVGGARIQPVTVHGHAGMWIPVAHRIGYIDRSGQFTSDTVRRSGPVLLWERDGVTFRVEGPHTLAEAMTIANSIA